MVIEEIVKTQRPYIKNLLRHLVQEHPRNTNFICEYILSEQTRFNIKDSTKEGKIKTLVWLSSHFGHKKSFDKLNQTEILSYLNHLRKPFSQDPNQRWVGSYNARQLIFSSFFRWLHNREESNPKNYSTPHCMSGIKRLPRKEKTPYKPSDLFTARNNEIFLKYCPSKRDRCFHAIAIDTSARPHELLNLKIKDIIFKITEDGKQYAEITIAGGKSPRPRTVPLFNSIPYVKDWINDHPTGDNPDSWLFVSLSKNRFAGKLTYDGLYNHYVDYYKSKYFPNLVKIDDGSVPDIDKAIIKDMLLKPWALYNLRHSSLTEKSLILKEHVLRDHAGWTMTSKMPQIYIHYFGNESSKSILQAMGIIKVVDSDRSCVLRIKQCPNCNEPNKKDSRFCAKCQMVLSYDAYSETVQNREIEKTEFSKLKSKVDKFEIYIQHLIDSGQLEPERTSDNRQF
jgi:integrase